MKSAARRISEDAVWRYATLAVLLVLLRSFAPAWYEGLDFDSDQAIVGLMAKHLRELRTFPLFYYGQNYMLGVQAWLAAPLFALGPPSVFLLRVPPVVMNCAAAVVLLAALVRDAGLRPSQAFVAAAPFIMPAPAVAIRLLDLYSNIEPLLYVLVLWALRDRPFAFGTLLGVAYLQREFTIFAVPALLIVKAIDGSLMTRQTRAWFVRMALAFAGVWVIVDILKRNLSGLGPSVGAVHAGPLMLQMEMLGRRLCLTPLALLARLDSLVVDCLPDLFGTRRLPLNQLGLNATASGGSELVLWALGVTAVLMAVKPGTAAPDVEHRRNPGFCWYLGLVGAQAALAYPLSCDVLPGYPGVLRYVMLVLFVPIALFSWFVTRQQPRALHAIVVGVFLLWAGVNLRDNLSVLQEYITNPPPNKFRGLADYLVGHQIKYARAPYWDSYIVDFLSDERVIVSSTGKVRIEEYQRRVGEHSSSAVQIQRVPCSEGIHFDAWCISGPPIQ